MHRLLLWLRGSQMTEAGARLRALMLEIGLVSMLPSCRRGCGEAARGADANALELLRKVRVPEEATSGWVDVDDEHEVFMVAGLAGPIQIWSEAPSTEGQVVATLAVQGTLVAARLLGSR